MKDVKNSDGAPSFEGPAPANLGSDVLVALSLATLNLLPLWRVLLHASPTDSYFISVQSHASLAGALVSCVSVALLTLGCLRLSSNPASRISSILRIGVISVLLINPLNFLRGALELFEFGALLKLPIPALAVLAILVIAVSGLVLVFARHAATALGILMLILSPFAFLTLLQVGWGALTAPNTTLAVAPAPTGDEVTNRVVWLLFDGLDNRAFFGEKPEALEMPEFDRFRSQALVAKNAHKAADNRTLTNVPAMTIGRKVLEAKPTAANRLMILGEGDSEPAAWGSGPNLFSEARRLGGRVALVGFYHPLCRVFEGHFDFCVAFPFKAVIPVVPASVLEAVRGQLRLLTPLYRKQNSVIIYQKILAATEVALSERPADLTYIHLSVPHTPQIWDRKRGEFRSGLGFWRADYRDNFALSDRMLGEIRERLERDGSWNRSAVLITSDHGFDHWKNKKGVPPEDVVFMLKMPGQESTLLHGNGFSAIVVKDLLLAVLVGELPDARAVSHWLDARSGG